ncbi:MAG: hypothetical protein A2X67_14280 [Ignavibacteria bacterium GWA2_55_11]|nr:MAG: hypothetical protein A2X67_14280 [Ignavibacteria bacterium GWA2_55_11]OGU66342.1 MAG: hypothetical protein A3C56_02065 [Ignavibacteria bacterium RIFCSPHIGHO2_02_FULL_56_12]OGU70740.1 MAG: hypothetical protein A3H45_02390 [Ignavibacteria bacterium RIFCSPLOWO2_02_FULL_55_14]
MSDLLDPETLWLNLTNIFLGVVTVICIAAVAHVAAKEWYARSAFRSRIPVADDTHAFDIADLGITMADGGERIDERHTIGHRPADDDVPPNIIRSDN